MKHLPHALLTLAALSLLAASPKEAAKPGKTPTPQQSDKDLLQGTWELVEAHSGGRVERVPESERGSMVLLFLGDTLTSFDKDGRVTEAKYHLGETKDPREIELVFEFACEVFRVVKNTYSLEGDTLRMWSGETIKDLSKELRKKAGAQPYELPDATPPKGLLLVLKRAKSDYELLEGTWETVSVERAGKPVEDSPARGEKSVFKGRKLIKRDDTENDYRLDPRKRPKQMFIVEESQVYIYSLEGDTLRLCKDALGPLPTDFTTKKGDGRVLFTLKRVKGEDKKPRDTTSKQPADPN